MSRPFVSSEKLRLLLIVRIAARKGCSSIFLLFKMNNLLT